MMDESNKSISQARKVVAVNAGVGQFLRSPRAIALLLGAGIVGTLLSGYYTLTVIFIFFEIAALVSFARQVTGQHEDSMSVPTSMNSLQSSFSSLALDSKTRVLAEQGQVQLDQMKEQYRHAQSLLADKLNPTEAAFARFTTTFEFASRALFAALEDVVQHLRQMTVLSENDPTLALQRTKVSESLGQNQELLRVFSEAVAALIAMETHSTRAELPDAIEALQRIAARAQHLSISNGDKHE
jgi:hypothetical protein